MNYYQNVYNMKFKYILIIVVAFVITASCSKKDAICGIWFEDKNIGSVEINFREDGTCLLSLDDPFTEGIKEIKGNWTRNDDKLYINYEGQYNSGSAVEFNILSLDDHTLVLRRGEEGRAQYFNRRE